MVGAWILLACILARNGIIHLLGPVFFFELLRGSRRRIHLHRVIYALILLGSIAYLFSIRDKRYYVGDLSNQADLARSFFVLFFVIQLLLIGLMTPVMVAGCIAEEKERRTLEFVLATDLRGREIMFGKLAARIASMLLLLLTGLPILGCIQLFGGIMPEEVFAAIGVSIVTLLSIASLSIASSVLMRRSRDAILTALAVVLAYSILSLASQGARRSDFGKARFNAGNATVKGTDIIDIFQAGNPMSQMIEIARQESISRFTGKVSSYGELLSESVRNYSIFHGVFGLVMIGWALVRLRPVSLKQMAGGRSRSRRRRSLPPIRNSPMLWKETYAERGPRLHLLLRLLFILLFVASFAWPATYFFDYVVNASPTLSQLVQLPFTDSHSPYWGWNNNTDWTLYRLQTQVNHWTRIAFPLVSTLLLLGVLLRAAGRITGERARQTLDELLTSPLSNRTIIDAKWAGSLLGMRRGLIWVVAIFVTGLMAGGVNLLGVVGGFVYLSLFAVFFASLGVWCSVVGRTTFRATVMSFVVGLIAFGGHWILTALCCCLPFEDLIHDSSDVYSLAKGIMLGLTPPVALGFVPIQSMREIDQMSFDMQISVLGGFLSSLVFPNTAFALRRTAIMRFAEIYNRTPVRRPELRATVANTNNNPSLTDGMAAKRVKSIENLEGQNPKVPPIDGKLSEPRSD